MKILHTSDLHIGKKLDGVSRLDEQRAVLYEILNIASENNVDIALIAGDVFDTFIPSAEAENLFFDFLDELSKREIITVCISGNHDDADRLTASKTLASKRGIYLCGGSNQFENAEHFGIKLVECGANHLLFEKDGERVFIATVQYFGEAPIGYEIDKEQPFNDRVKDILHKIFANKSNDACGILLTHLFMLGGSRSEGERDIDLGGVKVLSPSAIPTCCQYTALGHLHKKQIASKEKNAIYSGSPLQYSYDEVGEDKSVVILDIENNRVSNISEVKLTSGKKLAKLSCVGVENAEGILLEHTDKFVDLTVITDRPLTFDETAEIKKRFTNVTKIKLELIGDIEQGSVAGRKNLSEKELFVEFYKQKYGNAPDDDILKAYLEIMSEE